VLLSYTHFMISVNWAIVGAPSTNPVAPEPATVVMSPDVELRNRTRRPLDSMMNKSLPDCAHIPVGPFNSAIAPN